MRVVEPVVQYVNTFGRWEMPWSEVCMHLRITDVVMDVELLPGGMAQLWTVGGRKYSAPITQAEAGVPRKLRTRPERRCEAQ